MGYYKLRRMLYGRKIFFDQVAKETGIDINTLYAATVKTSDSNKTFTEEQKQIIYDKYFKGLKSWEEVFENYEDSSYDIESILKRQARNGHRH